MSVAQSSSCDTKGIFAWCFCVTKAHEETCKLQVNKHLDIYFAVLSPQICVARFFLFRLNLKGVKLLD